MSIPPPLIDKGPRGLQGVFLEQGAVMQLAEGVDRLADEGKVEAARALLKQWGAELPGHNAFDLLWAAAMLLCNILTQASQDREQQRKLLRSFLAMVVVADASFQAGAVNYLEATKQ